MATPERALQVTGDALADLPGEKVVVFLGWGLGRYVGGFGTRMTPEYGPAVDALLRARASVFAIDVNDAISHDLELGLRRVAEDTGGTYEKTTYFPSQAASRLARVITGYYLLDRPRPAAGRPHPPPRRAARPARHRPHPPDVALTP